MTRDVPDGAIVAGSPAKLISTVEQFMEKMKNRETVPTKMLKQDEKRKYLKELHPEWFM